MTQKRTAEAPSDFQEHLRALEERGLLIRIDRPINKDTEIHPLVRWQFLGNYPEEERKAFLFTNVIDSKGRKYDIPVLVGGLAANREIYRIGIDCPFDEIDARWVRAAQHPIPPNVVKDAPCHDIVVTGKALDRPGQGLDGIPLPISTPGWDISPYTTLSQYVTKDPDTGIQNMGNYRGQVKARRRLGMNPSVELRAGIYTHWLKYKARGEPMPCAVVIGCPPAVSYTAVQKMPEGLDELAVAGALVGAPINAVRAKTVDLLVPAEAEIVVEGFIDTRWLEPEAPFGESHGYVNLQEYNAYMDVTAITRRRHPIVPSFIMASRALSTRFRSASSNSLASTLSSQVLGAASMRSEIKGPTVPASRGRSDSSRSPTRIATGLTVGRRPTLATPCP